MENLLFIVNNTYYSASTLPDMDIWLPTYMDGMVMNKIFKSIFKSMILRSCVYFMLLQLKVMMWNSS